MAANDGLVSYSRFKRAMRIEIIDHFLKFISHFSKMILIESPSLISIFSNEEKREIADYKTARDLPTTCNASGKKRPTGFALHE